MIKLPKVMKYYILFSIVIIIIAIIALVSTKDNSKEQPKVNESDAIINTEEDDYDKEDWEDWEYKEDEDEEEELTGEQRDYIYFEETLQDMFSQFQENEVYQTVSEDEDDLLIDITFKDYGTVRFKLYQDIAPNATNWFGKLVKNNVNMVSKKSSKEKICFYFETTEREFDDNEMNPNIFPMKYSLYQTRNGCHTFYICTTDYVPTVEEQSLLTDTSKEFLNKYGGNFTQYQKSIVLGRAISGFEILDKIDGNFEIESVIVVQGSFDLEEDEFPDINIEQPEIIEEDIIEDEEIKEIIEE